ncbi:MAG TPA: hypothetical protein VKW09_14580 [bacterium]|nr:hypothetical protein [bacterium]
MNITAGIIEAERFYAEALRGLVHSRLPFMIGGAYALRVYAGIIRHTKDLDVFCARRDRGRIVRLLSRFGDRVERHDPTWIIKVFRGDLFIDVIFGSGNGICHVDQRWFKHARPARLLGSRVRLIPPEEMIWSKAFVQDRYRFDGADIAHILRREGRGLDWRRLLDRMRPEWEVLLAHLMNVRFIYPGERDIVPDWVLHELLARLEQDQSLAVRDRPPRAPVCRGTLLTPHDYVEDVTAWGYADARADIARRARRRLAVQRHAYRRAG